MDERLAETVFHGRNIVLGCSLRPLTFFHHYSLASVGSAFCTPGARVSFADLYLAVEICRRPRAQVAAWLSRRRSRWERLRAWIVVRIFAKHFFGELAAFHSYMHDNFAPPECFDSTGASCKSPWPLPQIARLMFHGHMSLDEAWDAHPGFTAHLMPALQEAAGHEVNIISEAEARALEEAGYDPVG